MAPIEDTAQTVDPSESGDGISTEEPTAEETTESAETMGEGDLLVLSAEVAPEGFPGSGWNAVFEDINKDGLLQLEEVTNFSGTALVVPGGNVEPGFYDQLTNVPDIADISTTSGDPGGWSFAQSFDSNTADIFTDAWTYEISPVVFEVPQAEDPIGSEEPTEPEETAEPVFGTDGPDTIEITGSGALVFAGAGDDIVDATRSGGGNRIYGGSDNDDVILNAKDHSFGDEGNDRFFVQTGGGNSMTGGAQGDQFWIAGGEIPDVSSDGLNIITDFDSEEGDVIGIAGLEGVDSFEDLSLDLISTSEGPNTLISILNPDGADQPLAFVQGVELGDASSFVIVQGQCLFSLMCPFLPSHLMGYGVHTS